jgi:hypothetical protein
VVRVASPPGLLGGTPGEKAFVLEAGLAVGEGGPGEGFDAAARRFEALYLPNRKRILLDNDLPPLKHRWNDAHEIGHDIIPWHAGMMLGDSEKE